MDILSRRSRGFTLIELLVVIAIIAVLAAILMPVISSVQEKSRQARCSANLIQIATALRQYKTDWGQYPFRPYYDASLGIYMGGVSALYPDYIRSKAVLICPNDAYNLKGLADVPNNYSSYNGLVARFVTGTTATGADGWKFAKQDPLTDPAEATDYACVTYNYGGYSDWGWDRSYWNSATGAWASEWPAGGTAPRWLRDEGKKWRDYPRLMNSRAPDNTIVVRCRAHHKWYGKDETYSSGQESGKWRDVVLRVGGDIKTVNYWSLTQTKVYGTESASAWRVQR